MADDDDLEVCGDCGALFDPATQRGYVVEIEAVALCAACATRRGGVYDEVRDTWTVAPDVSDLERE
jgi:hypothetical protein